MSAELETLLNDLIMKAERTSAEFRQEVANTRRVQEATAIMRRLNAASYEQAIALLQDQQPMPMVQQPMPQFLSRLAN